MARILKASRSLPGRRKTRLRILAELLVLAVLLWILCVSAVRALRQIAIAQIAALTNTQIKVSTVNFNLNGSVSIKALSIRPDEPADYDDTILKAEKVYAHFKLPSLLLFKPKLKEIRLEDFVFNAQQNIENGRWNIDRLRLNLASDASGQMPAIRLTGGKLLYSKVSRTGSRILGAIPLDARFAFDQKSKNGYSFEVTTARRPGFAGKSKIDGLWQPGKISFSGGLSSADVPGFERVWMIYALAGVFEYDQSGNLKSRFLAICKNSSTGISPMVAPI